MGKIRVLVVDDHPLMREALCSAIDAEPDMEIAGQACNGIEAAQQALTLKPDVTVMDLFMPGKDGIETIAEICAANANARILALTSSTDEDKMWAAVQAGALGYLLKDTQRADLLRAIRDVSRGNPCLPPQLALKLMERMRKSQAEPPAAAPSVDPLTPRERQILQQVGRGDSNRQIAQALGLSEGTVRVHVHNILGKLGLESRSQAIAYALREKLA